MSNSGAGIVRRVARCGVWREPVVVRSFKRCMATETFPTSALTADTPVQETTTPTTPTSDILLRPLSHTPPANPFITPVQTTLYSFPDFEAIGSASYPSTHLFVPLRKDILHRAVIYEADATRQGTANTKTRYEVAGSHKKMGPQKGTGRARVGTRQSPIRRGGGVVFGPKPRDFSTDLNVKEYDLAWRIALSYRYRRGQLLVLDGKAQIDNIGQHSRARYLKEMFDWHNMGHAHRRTLLITQKVNESMAAAFEDEGLQRAGKLLDLDDVDVKDLLELGRIVIERRALDQALRDHQSDLPVVQHFQRSSSPPDSSSLKISTSYMASSK